MTVKELQNEKYSKQCAYNDHGYRCQNDGHMALTTHGEGPWYCREHFATLQNWPPYKVPAVDETQIGIDNRVRKIVPQLEGESEHDWSMRCRAYVMDAVRKMVRKKRTAGEKDLDWAFKISMREARGESLDPAIVTMANEALAGRSLREPGSDDE